MDFQPKEKTMELQERARESQRIAKAHTEPLSRDVRSVMRSLGVGVAFSYKENFRVSERSRLMARWPLLRALNNSDSES
ncbi:hypothetical protein [Spongiibacter marinus]|uniref:hypothetical protein n=1 Tax=Spongiibacter marinus TaxID=354246 RepID=UPI0004891245|nr:hypothetical protein [Spongiibacter marinus]